MFLKIKKMLFFIIYRIFVVCYNSKWVIVMNDFFSRSQFVRHFPTVGDALIRTVGYDDFGEVKPLHAYRMQNFYTWHFVISGCGTLEIGGVTRSVEKGQMFFIPPGVEMRYFPKENEPWKYVWFSLMGETAAAYGSQLGFTIDQPVRNYEIHPGIVPRLKTMLRCLAEENGGLFTVLSAFYGIMEICTSDATSGGIQAVKKYLDESFAIPGFSVEQLCFDSGMSHAHMLRLFRQAYGTSVIGYVISKRIALACELLETTKLPIGSVAVSCGFSDEQHFMKTFKRHKGVSALQYRKEYKKAHGV